MQVKINLKNNGTVNVGENIQNNNYYEYNTLAYELNILRDKCDSEDREKIDEIIDLLKNGKQSKAKNIIDNLSLGAKKLIEEFSLSLLIDFIKGHFK